MAPSSRRHHLDAQETAAGFLQTWGGLIPECMKSSTFSHWLLRHTLLSAHSSHGWYLQKAQRVGEKEPWSILLVVFIPQESHLLTLRSENYVRNPGVIAETRATSNQTVQQLQSDESRLGVTERNPTRCFIPSRVDDRINNLLPFWSSKMQPFK